MKGLLGQMLLRSRFGGSRANARAIPSNLSEEGAGEKESNGATEDLHDGHDLLILVQSVAWVTITHDHGL